MNRSQSKYFATAEKMDSAFLELLEEKDFAYITVKEICQRAGVHRSTFYLHYGTVGDLLSESVEYINRQFLEYMKTDSAKFIKGLPERPLSELYLVTREYLMPYLRYIKEHRRLFCTALKNAAVLQLEESYAGLSRNVLRPILERYGVPENRRGYVLDFYIQGIMGIITRWLKGGCVDSEEFIFESIRLCIPEVSGEKGDKT